MAEATTTASKAKDDAAKDATAEEDTAEAKPSGDYVLPVVHMHVPSKLVDVGFWGGLVGAVALGAIDPPIGVLVGAGVVVARHQSSS